MTALGSEHIARALYRYDNVHAPLPNPQAFRPEHVEHYRQHGFIAIENVFSPEEVQGGKAGISHLIAGGNPAFKGVQFERSATDIEKLSVQQREDLVRKIMDMIEYEPRLKHMATHPSMLPIASALVGAELKLIQDMGLLKPAHVGREKPWHQDTAYFVYEPLEDIIGVWIALDPATLENGCMHVIPGSHLEGPRPHYHDRDCQLPDEDVKVANDVAVPLKPGGVLFFSSLLHHGTPPNRSPSRRRALQFHFAAAHCRRIDGSRHEQLFHDDAGYAGCAGWQTGQKERHVSERGKA